MSEFDSMIELAIELMEKKRKPHTVHTIAKEVFELKGLKVNENPELMGQFINDFMLCGIFICCGEDKKGNKVWDLKTRQKFELLEKDGTYIDDPYGDDEDVIKNELKDEFEYLNENKPEYDDESLNDDSDDEDNDDEDEKDDIEEELMLNDDYDEFNDVEEDDYDDPDDITIDNKKGKK